MGCPFRLDVIIRKVMFHRGMYAYLEMFFADKIGGKVSNLGSFEDCL